MKIRDRLTARNEIFLQIREFFAARNFIEVDTPLMAKHTVTDPYMRALSVVSAASQPQGYLQTSPEYGMKKLLSLGSGDIFQLSKMFRSEENGKIHSPEFTLLEWYRVGWDHWALMDECKALLCQVLGARPVKSYSYQQAFQSFLEVDPFEIQLETLAKLAIELLGDLPKDLMFDDYLSLLFSQKIEPHFDPDEITFVTDYPPSQASLAKTRINPQGIEVAERFEIYLGGIELANGFHELTDASLQLARFHQDNEIRAAKGLPKMAIDPTFINALKRGLPACAGVALGVDRLLMIKLGESDIKQVITHEQLAPDLK